MSEPLTGADRVPEIPVKHDLITVVGGTVECYLCGKGVSIKEACMAEHESSDIKAFAHEDCVRSNPQRAVRRFTSTIQRALSGAK